jgi:hypothetical protein
MSEAGADKTELDPGELAEQLRRLQGRFDEYRGRL